MRKRKNLLKTLLLSVVTVSTVTSMSLQSVRADVNTEVSGGNSGIVANGSTANGKYWYNGGYLGSGYRIYPVVITNPDKQGSNQTINLHDEYEKYVELALYSLSTNDIEYHEGVYLNNSLPYIGKDALGNGVWSTRPITPFVIANGKGEICLEPNASTKPTSYPNTAVKVLSSKYPNKVNYIGDIPTSGFKAIGMDFNVDYLPYLGLSSYIGGGNYETLPYRGEEIKTAIDKAVRTSDKSDNANVQAVFNGYMKKVQEIVNKLPAGDMRISRFNNLKTRTGWTGGANDKLNLDNIGFVFELVGSYRYEVTKGTFLPVIYSYRDLVEMPFRDGNNKHDITMGYRFFSVADKDKDAEGKSKLLSWQALYTGKNNTYKSKVNGNATFLMMNEIQKKEESRVNAINVVVKYEGDLKAQTSKNDKLINTWGITTSESKSKDYTPVLSTNVVQNWSSALYNTNFNISLVNSNLTNKVTFNSSDRQSVLTHMTNGTKTNNVPLRSYNYGVIEVNASEFDLTKFSQIDLSNVLSKYKVNTWVNPIKSTDKKYTYGNTYQYAVHHQDVAQGKTLVGSIIEELSSAMNGGLNHVSSASIGYNENGKTYDDMANLQASTMGLGKLQGVTTNKNSNVMKNAKGKIYLTISHLNKDTNVTSKVTEVYVDNTGKVNAGEPKAQTYASTTARKWSITKRNNVINYLLVWKATNDNNNKFAMNQTNAQKVVSSIVQQLGTNYRGDVTNTIKNLFANKTGVTLETVVALDKTAEDKGIHFGAFDDGTNIVGANALVISIAQDRVLSTESTDIIDENELNAVYFDLLGYREGNTIQWGYSIGMSGYNSTVTDSISGDLHNKFGLNALFSMGYGNPKENPKRFSGLSYPSYGYTISRTLWGDNMVIASHRNDSSTIKELQSLGFPVGLLGNSTALTQNTSATSGVRVTVGGKKDTYKFTATVDTGNRFGTLTMINQYVVNHQVRKYTPATLGTSTNNKLNQVIFNSGGNKLAWVTGYDAILKVYPEVTYKYYRIDKYEHNNQYINNTLWRRDVVVLGEKPRTTKPVAINGVIFKGSDLAGEVVSNGALSGQTQGSGLVVPQGVDITMKANGNASFKLVSYVLDLIDKLKVGNSFSAVNEHNNYVNTFLSGVTFKTKLQVGTKEFDTNATVNSEKGASTDGRILMEFKGGKLTDVTKVAVIRDMQATYGISYDQATAMFNNSGIEQQLQAMFETKNSATNKSLNKWYDEESTLIVIHKYTTDVTFNNIFSQDKIDYGTVTTNGTSTSGATKHKTVDAYYKIKVELPSNFMGANLGNQATIVPEAEISGTRFKVSSSTTSDFDSNFGWN